MSVIVLLIIFSLLVAIIFLIAFIWSVKSGQYEDTYSPSVRILFDEKKRSDKKEKTDKNSPSSDENTSDKSTM
mgnify:CR=1 FL=1